MVPKCSVFADIFDVDHFITTLQDDVKIVKELPRRLITIPRARKHFTSWAGVGYYEEMTHLFKNYQVREIIPLILTDLNHFHLFLTKIWRYICIALRRTFYLV